MPVGTIRGRVELDAPALRVMRDLERQGIRTEAQMKRLGRSIDEVSGRDDQAAIDRLRRKVRDLGAQTTMTEREASRAFRTMRRNVVRDVRYMKAELTELEVKLDRIGTRHATAKVDVDGIAAAIVQIDLLESKLDRLSARRSTPRVALGGGFTGGGFGGGGGGGGGGGSGLRSVGVGPLNFGSASGLALIGAALPAAQALLGSTTAVAGSLGGALLGGGALGVAGGAGLLTGIGGLLAVAKPMNREIGDAYKAQTKFTQAVQDFGRKSRQAASAKRELDQAMAKAPRGTRQLLGEVSDLRSTWQRVSRPGQEDLVRLGIGGLRDARRFAQGAGGAAANRVAGATSREGLRFSKFLTGPTGARLAGQGAAVYGENLGNVRLATQYGIEWFTNVTQAARPFFREATAFVKTWMRGWATNTRDIEGTRRKIAQMVDNLKSWMRLTSATGRLLKDILIRGAPEGQSAVDRLTMQLDRWDAWIQQNPAQVQDFFRRTVDSTIQLARALGSVAHTLSQIATILEPVLSRFSQLVTLAGGLGLLTPGVGTLALGGFRGMRGGRGGGRGGAGGGMGLIPLGMGGGAAGGAAAEGGLGSRMLGGAAVGFGAVRGAWGNWRTNVGLRRSVLGGATLAERDAARAALATRATAGMTLGGAMANSTYSLARGFGYGRTASAAAQIGGLLRGGALARGLAGAGKAYLPIGALMAGLDAYGFQGNAAQKLQAGASTFSLGLISRPRTDSQKLDAVTGRVQDIVSRPVMGARGLRQQIRGLRFAARSGGDAFIGTDADASQIARGNQMIRDELRVRLRMLHDYTRRRNQTLDSRSRQNAGRYFGEFQQGFRNRAAQEGVVPAFTRTIGGTIQQIGEMRRAGGRALAQMTLSWARAQAQANPALQREYDALVTYVERRFKGLRGGVRIVQGQILDGSKRQWGQIADAIASQARRGVSEASAEFQRLQAIAVGQLEQMGFTHSGAVAITQAERKGGAARRAASRIVQAGPNFVGPIRGEGRVYGGGKTGDGTGMDPRQSAHLASFSGGSRSLMGANAGLGLYDRYAAQFGLNVTSGLRPGAITASGNPSLHGIGAAIDESGPAGGMLRYARFMAQRFGSGLDELIHTPLGYGIKNGRRVPLSFWGDTVNRMHYSHVHVGDATPGGAAGGVLGGMIGGGIAQAIHLHARRSKLRGVPGALSGRAMASLAAGMEAAINARVGTGGGQASAGAGGAYNQAALARLWVGAGGPANIANLMGAIALAESGGNPRAHNPSGASGLWQILGEPFPGNVWDPSVNARMAVAKYRTQGLGAWEAYTNGSYQRYLGSFAKGGRFITRSGRAGMFMAGEGPTREEVTVRPYSPPRKPAHGPRLALGGGVTVEVRMGHVTIREEADIEKVATKVGRKVLAALRGSPDEELSGS